MPFGDPAGYLPNVKRARKRKGQAEYQPAAKYMARAKRAPHTSPRPGIEDATGGAMAPEPRGYKARKRRKNR